MKLKTTLGPLAAMMVAAGAVGIAAGDDDHRGRFTRWLEGMEAGAQAVESQPYVEDCGSCHFPYQPGLLPPPSWEKLLNGLSDHFGDNAELPPERLALILDYLLDNAAGRVSYGASNKIVSTLGEENAPLRITDTPYFRHEHREIPAGLAGANPGVGSLSYCDACHTNAMTGSFDEDEVRIPGFGRWDD